MKGWKTALALGAAAAAAGAVAGEYFYRFALTQQIDKTAAFNAPHNRPTGAPRGTLAADREWLNAQPHEDWWLTSGDGLQLHALCVRAGGNAPWAVLCHGYTGQASGMAEYARRFYDAGFSLLLPDARGHGQSEGGYIGMGWPERRDIAAWVQRVTAENGAPDIVLMGVSMGAATVMMTAGEPLPPNVRAIVEDCGYTTAWEEFRYQLKKTYGLPPFPVLYTADALLRRRAGFSLREASAAAQVAHSRTPMLFIHGGKDAFVPFAMLVSQGKICGAGCRPCGVPAHGARALLGKGVRIHRPLDAAARRGADSGCGPGGKAGIRRRIHKRKSSGEQADAACSPLLLL